MADKLDDLLRALPEPSLDHQLDQLEPLVWKRIERSRREIGFNAQGLRLQFAVAVATLCLGMALGWSQTGSHTGVAPRQEPPLLLTHADLALVTGLGAAQ